MLPRLRLSVLWPYTDTHAHPQFRNRKAIEDDIGCSFSPPLSIPKPSARREEAGQNSGQIISRFAGRVLRDVMPKDTHTHTPDTGVRGKKAAVYVCVCPESAKLDKLSDL